MLDQKLENKNSPQHPMHLEAKARLRKYSSGIQDKCIHVVVGKTT